MRRLALPLTALALAACGSGPDVKYTPAPQILPQNISKIAVRPFVNKTSKFGLEDKLTLRVIDEFLADGTYPVVQENAADGVIVGEITRYILTPIQYDENLIPTAYKLLILLDLKFLDRKKNQFLWVERNFEGIQTYASSLVPGGLTEIQAQEAIWDIFARDIVKRTIDGFGESSGGSNRRYEPDVSTQEIKPNR